MAIRALLLTDVVDSTQRAAELGDARMAEVWAAHDDVSRRLLPRHRGREIDKTDGFLLMFEAASDAVAYAVDYHRALRALSARFHVPLAARAGLHVGDVLLRETPPEQVALGAKPLEVEGLPRSVAAWVMSVAQGGQTLVTEAARDALGPTALRVTAHGLWRMRGVLEPIALFEAGEEGAPPTPPLDSAKLYRVERRGDLWLPVRPVRHNLPAERVALADRAADLTELARRVGDARLVTVAGIGGAGKTQLVTRFGWTWLHDYRGGVWFCDLSDARAVDDVANAVARAIDLPLGPGDPVQQVGRAIADRGACLVILDRFEQIARHGRDTVGRWLDRAGEARFVVTSREILGLPGESILALAPPGDRVDHQADLREALDRSWDLLSPDEQAALAQLSVFEGAFTLDAAEAVLQLDALWPVDALQALVDKSLVQALPDDRFDLLPSVQRYARERLGGGAVDAEASPGGG